MQKTLLVLAFAGLASHAAAAEPEHPRERCYGIAKAGQNACMSASGSHACAGLATRDNAPEEWIYTDKGTCAGRGGSTTYKKS